MLGNKGYIYFKKALRNRAHNGTVEPQDELTHLEKGYATRPRLAHGELALEFARFKRVYSLMACFIGSKNA